jgi:amino acid transporter
MYRAVFEEFFEGFRDRLSWKNRLLAILLVIAGGVALIALPWIGSWVVTLSGWDWWGATLAVIYGLCIVLALAGRAIVKLWGDSRKHRRKLKEWVDEPVEIVGVSMMLLGFTVAVLGTWYLHLQEGGAPEGIFADLVSDFYANISVDFVSVGIAILIINRLYEQRSKLEEKQRIIEQMRSPSAEFAKEAARIVREKGWLIDGSLRGANLRGAHYNADTTWPEGFDPVAAGAVLEE